VASFDDEHETEPARVSRPKPAPPAFEDRTTVDPHPPGVDREHAHELPDAPDDGPEAEPERSDD
jgi:hypothetical protein